MDYRNLVGKRIRLMAMGSDPDPVPAGTTGTVRNVVFIGDEPIQVWVDWDVNRSLHLIPGEDRFVVL